MKQINTYLDELVEEGEDGDPFIILTEYDIRVIKGMIKKYGEDMYDAGYEQSEEDIKSTWK